MPSSRWKVKDGRIMRKNNIQSFVYDPYTTISIEEMSSRFSNKPEAFASGLLENLEEMFLRYCPHSDMSV